MTGGAAHAVAGRHAGDGELGGHVRALAGPAGGGAAPAAAEPPGGDMAGGPRAAGARSSRE
eukprot:scaffold80553_cov48-Phaeocystis_antarctica.AAC.2